MIEVALLAALAAAPARAQFQPGREPIEAKVRAILARMKAIRDESPFTEEAPREEFVKVVLNPRSCRKKPDDKYCRLYEEVYKAKGLGADDVFAAFTADEIIRNKLLQRVTGCTGDIRVFAKLAWEGRVEFRRLGAVYGPDYAAACFEQGRKLERRRPGAHVNGHAAALIRWGGKWRVLDTSAYDELSYGHSGPPAREPAAVEKPEEFLGRELYFGDRGPYVVTDIDDAMSDVYTYAEMMKGSDGSCRHARPPRERRP